jgi:hypothetical protein
MNIINMTPHPINLVDKQGIIIEVFPSNGIIRLESQIMSMGYINDIVPITKTVFNEPEGLPNYDENTYYIVSQLVKNAIDRKDLIVPTEILRDEKGNILGCCSFGI